ncbi:hypothetical protein [Gluconacetobacter dulcium]|uniref:Uncharacterized protein n=1 Tax=Gluconacetobacter dulcium TaxID=2729096 RepID=A0A7W4PIW9_9PROT|nr:hypothetical protein [Gluconacetobacter dulcium]MBB2199732.1 hypothetical protein [Gluconacetobacter dulcium]
MAILSVDGAYITLDAPFHPELACQAGRYRGRFVGKGKWRFDPKWEPELRAMCRLLFGVDGRPETVADQIDLTVAVNERSVAYPLFRRFNADIYLGGRQVAGVLKGRTIARPGKGIRFVKGEPRLEPQGLAWWLSVPTGAEFIIRGVPRMAVPFMEAGLVDHGHLVAAEAA